MADLTLRHGDGVHFMRPDRVIRTGVLSPMMGYHPVADVQQVALTFTQGPARGMMLQGFGEMPGPLARLWARIKMRVAEKRAQKLMSVAMMPPVALPSNPTLAPPQLAGMPGPAPAMAGQIAPYLASQMVGAMELMARRYGQGYPAAAADALVMRPIRRWY